MWNRNSSATNGFTTASSKPRVSIEQACVWFEEGKSVRKWAKREKNGQKERKMGKKREKW